MGVTHATIVAASKVKRGHYSEGETEGEKGSLLIYREISGDPFSVIALTVGINKANLIRLMYFRPHPAAYGVLFVGFIVFLMFLGDLYQRGRTSIVAISPDYVVVNVPRLLGDVKFQVPRDILTEVKLIRNERGFREPRGVVLKFKERPGIFVEPDSSNEALTVFNALKESEAATAPGSQTAAPTTAANGESPKRPASSNLAANSEEKSELGGGGS